MCWDCDFVGRLTRSLPLSRSGEQPVYAARVPAAPFCESRMLSGLAHTPYNFVSAVIDCRYNK